MSSSADAVTREASARSAAVSRVMSRRRVSTVTGAPSAAASDHAGGGAVQQVGVPVVQDPVLRTGQPRRQPAAHRAGAAAQVVDHVRGVAGQPATDRVDQVRGAGRRVGGLPQPQPRRAPVRRRAAGSCRSHGATT